MVKFTLLLCGAAMLAGLAMPTRNAAAAPAETKDDLKSLVQKYIGTDGLYTKKTTIGLNEAAKTEHIEYFHASLTEAKRTTYYAPNKLLLAKEDGSIPKGSGSYYFNSEDHKVHRASALEGSTQENMWSNLDAGQVAYRDEVTRLEDKFVTLNTFVADGYFSAWGYDDVKKVYYYDLTEADKEKDASGVYKCSMWNDFLGFCAPMLYSKSGEYFSAKSLTIEEAYDTEGRRYLKLSMYLADGDLGKLDESYFAQARIYDGNIVFKEDFTRSFFVMKGTDRLGKMLLSEEGKKELVLKNVSLEKGDAVKLWSTEDLWYGASAGAGFEHNLTVQISKNSKLVDDQDNYVASESGQYDFYAKFDDSWNYTGTYIKDQSARTVYLQDTLNKGGVSMHYWGDNVIGTEWDYCAVGINTQKQDSGHNMYKVVIPGSTQKMIIRYDYKQSDNLDLGTDNAYWLSISDNKVIGHSYTWAE